MANNKFFKIIFFTIFLPLIVNSKSFAKELYVSTTGSDSVPYANNDISHPWVTPQKAWYNAQAGDTVYFRGGTYNISSTINTNGSNGYDGTLSNPIIFTTYANESVIFNATGGSGPMFQISKDYNVIKNFIIDGGGYFSRIFAVGWYDGEPVTGFEADGLTISDWADGDNCNAFYIGSSYASVTATKITIKNCRIQGNPAGSNQNYSGVQVFGATEFSIENNDVSQVVRGIYIKHSSYGYTDHNDLIKNNYIHRLNPGGIGLRINGNYIDVINNIIDGTTQFGEDAESGTNPNGNYVYFSHNTFIGPIEQLYDGGGIYSKFLNNIHAATAYIFRYSSNPENPQINETDYNLYSTSAVLHKGTTCSLANWRTHLVSDNTGGNRDANSISGTPTFEGGATPTTISGYKLTTSSTGYLSANDGKDMGAEVSLVGPAVSLEGTPLGAPASLKIINE